MPTLIIRFQTNELTPPPHAYAIEANIELNEDEITGTFEITYLGRDEMTEEELWEEGYTIHDDAKWSIDLPTPWLKHLQSIINSEKLNTKTELHETEDYWEVITDKSAGYPSNTATWFELLNQLQQAILEQNEIEAALKMSFIRIDGADKKTYTFNASFAKRFFNRISDVDDQELGWSELDTFLKDIFSGELLPENASKKEPTKTGLYLNPGDELWYELGKSYLIQPSIVQKYLL